MSFGIAIFLSSLFLGTVTLYIATKDRCNWKKIILLPVAGLILLACGLWIYNTIEQRPKVATSLWDIPLGATEGDVKFLKGAPKSVSKDKGEDKWEYLTEDSTLKQWDFIYRIGFNSGKVWLIEYFASPNRTYGPGIQGIDIGDPLVKITQKFGPASQVSASADQVSRVFSFARYQVVFELKENRVIGYGIFDTAIAPKGVEYGESKTRDIFDLLAEKERQRLKDRK